MYTPTGQAPELRESLRIHTDLHNFPPRGKPLENFGPQPMHTIPHMGGSLAKYGTRGGGNPNPPPPACNRGGGFAQPPA